MKTAKIFFKFSFIFIALLTQPVNLRGIWETGIEIEPSKRITAYVGSTVKINCSMPTMRRPKLQWYLPSWNPTTERGSNAVPMEGIPKIGATTKGIFRTLPVGSKTLQLIITNADTMDTGYYTCMDGRSELKEKVLLQVFERNLTCGSTQFQCKFGHCISNLYRCDKYVDCPYDESDEDNCDFSCDQKFQCRSGQCIEMRYVCDEYRVYHCRDGSDEIECEVRFKNSSVLSTHETHGFHFNAIYSTVAGVIGLVCITAVIIITVYRINMRRETMRRVTATGRFRVTRTPRNASTRAAWNQSTPFYQPPEVEQDYIPPHPCPASTNLAVNINLQITSGVPELVTLVTPPPYSEQDPLPEEDSPPPPYSTIDRLNSILEGSDEEEERVLRVVNLQEMGPPSTPPSERGTLLMQGDGRDDNTQCSFPADVLSQAVDSATACEQSSAAECSNLLSSPDSEKPSISLEEATEEPCEEQETSFINKPTS